MTHAWLKSYPKNIPWDSKIEPRPVQDLMDDVVERFGDRPAFDFLGKKWNWAEMGMMVDRTAKGLQDLGVGKGVNVGLFLPNCPYFLVAYYAILKAGGTVVNFNPLYVERELKHQIEDAQVDFMFTVNLELLYEKMSLMLKETRLKKLIMCKFTDILPFPKNILFSVVKCAEIAKIKPEDDVVWFTDMGKSGDKPAPVECNPVEDVAVLQYTGGTTGVPKGAMLTHMNVYSNAEQAAIWLQRGADGQGRMLGVLPFFHVFAMTAVMNLSVRKGLEIVALPRFDLEQTLKLIHKKKPQYFPAVPAIYNGINNYKGLEKYDLKSLECCISGGAPLPVEVKKQFETLTGCVVVEGYGLTESSPVLCVNPLEGENRAGSIGLPFPDTEIVLKDKDTGKIVGIGERGELCAKGPQVMKGYWRNQDATDATIKDGYLHTGDVAIMDEDGYFYIVDRIKDLIITNGYNVYPRHVEEAIYLHEDVEECIVAGIPDKSRGEIVKAWIKLKDGKSMSNEDMTTFLKDKISKIEMPRRIEFRDKPLPKTMIGKLSRKDILVEEAKQ